MADGIKCRTLSHFRLCWPLHGIKGSLRRAAYDRPAFDPVPRPLAVGQYWLASSILAFFGCHEIREIRTNAAAWWHLLALATWWLHGKNPGAGGYMEHQRQRTHYYLHSGEPLLVLEEEVGFEPTVPCGTPDFESGTFGHSATLPWH